MSDTAALILIILLNQSDKVKGFLMKSVEYSSFINVSTATAVNVKEEKEKDLTEHSDDFTHLVYFTCHGHHFAVHENSCIISSVALFGAF